MPRPAPTSIESSEIPNDYHFIYLNSNVEEFAAIRDAFCQQTKCRENAWRSFDQASDAHAWIKAAKQAKKIFVISSGGLCKQIITSIHDYSALRYVYVYCWDVDKYASLLNEYAKVREIFNDAALLIARLRNDIREELAPRISVPGNSRNIIRTHNDDSTSSTASAEDKNPERSLVSIVERARIAASPPLVDFRSDRAFNGSKLPNKHWCPWSENTCSKNFIVRGQATLAVMQIESAPFEIKLSNRSDPNDSTAYTIKLTVNATETQLETSKRVYDASHVPHHVLQPFNGKWRQYWISYFKKTRKVKYGLGEMRSFFTIFDVTIDESEANDLDGINFIHVQVGDKDRPFDSYSDSSTNFRFFIGSDPIVDEPPLTVNDPSRADSQDLTQGIVLSSNSLAAPCRRLFDSILNFELDPSLCEAIERSVRNENGWCRKKLVEKANRFGRPNIFATYLRLTIGKIDGTAPGHAYVIEVWPPGHFSPVHNHSNAYGVIKVLYGRILVKLYPELALNSRQHAPLETIFEKGQVTWLEPRLNQTHQVRNPDVIGKTCITIQCYQYGDDDDEHYEYFDYLNNDGQSIGQFDPKSDLDFHHFKSIIEKEKL